MADMPICRADGCVNTIDVEDLSLCSQHAAALVYGRCPIKIAVAECIIDGCGKVPRSTYAPYCQMHDARIRRHGDSDRKAFADVLIHSHGYRLVKAQGHPMARGMRALEHRVVYYDANPSGPEKCHWCGCGLTWATLQVDHLNGIRDDNRLTNLVASCGGCNRDRAKPAAARAARARAKGYMVNGRWLSIADAARKIGVAPSSIVARLNSGWSIERAMTEGRGVYGPKRRAA